MREVTNYGVLLVFFSWNILSVIAERKTKRSVEKKTMYNLGFVKNKQQLILQKKFAKQPISHKKYRDFISCWNKVFSL